MDCSPSGSSVHGKNSEVGCHSLLQGIFLTQGSNLGLPHWQEDFLLLSHLGSATLHILIQNWLRGIFSCRCHEHFKFKMSRPRIIIPTPLPFGVSTVPTMESLLNPITHSAPLQSNPASQSPEYFNFFPFLDWGEELSKPECWLTHSTKLSEWLTPREQSNGLTKTPTSWYLEVWICYMAKDN